MDTPFLNITYPIDDNGHHDGASVHSLWKVDTDDRYEVFYPQGFPIPGIFITIGGEGEVLCGEGRSRNHFFPVSGTFLIIDNKIACRYRCRKGARWRFYFIHFSDLSRAEAVGLAAFRLYSVPETSYAERICESIIAESLNREEGYGFLIDSLFCQYLVTSRRLSDDSRRGSDTGVKRILHWINGNFDRDIAVDSLVSMSGLNRTGFFQSFKRETGTTPLAYIGEIKMRSAQLVLRTTMMKNAEIASMLNFCDEYHFSKAFKRKYGMTPSRYRKLYRNRIP